VDAGDQGSPDPWHCALVKAEVPENSSFKFSWMIFSKQTHFDDF